MQPLFLIKFLPVLTYCISMLTCHAFSTFILTKYIHPFVPKNTILRRVRHLQAGDPTQHISTLQSPTLYSLVALIISHSHIRTILCTSPWCKIRWRPVLEAIRTFFASLLQLNYDTNIQAHLPTFKSMAPKLYRPGMSSLVFIGLRIQNISQAIPASASTCQPTSYFARTLPTT